MLASIVAAFFRHKLVSGVMIAACWPLFDQVHFIKQLSENNVKATFSCDLSSLSVTKTHGLHGVLYFSDTSNLMLNMTKREHFSTWYKWLVVGESVPRALHAVRYDADIALLKLQLPLAHNKSKTRDIHNADVHILDVYVDLRNGASLHPWALWSKSLGLQITHEIQRIHRRQDMKLYPLRISTPNSLYSPVNYQGTFTEYLVDDRKPEIDTGLRCSFATSTLLCKALNATCVVMHTQFHVSTAENDSVIVRVSRGEADFSGHVLRPKSDRTGILDLVTYVYPVSAGFMYIGERESSSNMYVEPFSAGVWVAFLGTGAVLAAALRLTAEEPDERRDAFHSTVASILQQDTSTVPEGAPGRAVFITLFIFAMLVHAYYTSAIVSALMNTGIGGPETITALADSKLSIATDNYDWMRHLIFDTKCDWIEGIEYLKKKKAYPNMYKTIDIGIKLIASGSTAYHAEYNNLYPLMKHLSDEQVCKVKKIDTLSKLTSYLVTEKRSQLKNVASTKGAWLHETGLAERTATRWFGRPPPCRTAFIAERVTLSDVAPMLIVTTLGAVLSALILVCELLVAKFSRSRFENLY